MFVINDFHTLEHYCVQHCDNITLHTMSHYAYIVQQFNDNRSVDGTVQLGA